MEIAQKCWVKDFPRDGVYGVVVCFVCQGVRLGLRKGQDYFSGAPRCSAKGCGARGTVWKNLIESHLCTKISLNLICLLR